MWQRSGLVSLTILALTAGAVGQPYDQQPPGPAYQDQASRDGYCRHAAAAETGYVTPGEAANQAQANGAIAGALGGAALGAIIGGRHAGTGAAIGAGAGLFAGGAVGASNAQAAANDVRRRYADAYYACMNSAPPGPGYGPPPPPPDYSNPPPPPPPNYNGPPPPPNYDNPPPRPYGP